MAKKYERSCSLPDIKEGRIQKCDGHLMRRTKYLRRWKKEYVEILPGKKLHFTVLDVCSVALMK